MKIKDKYSIRRSLAELLFRNVVWESNTKGTCECPGASLHSTKGRDCNIFLNGCVTIHCFHQSCADEVAEANEDFREQVNLAECDRNVIFLPSEEDRKHWKRQDELRRLVALAKFQLKRFITTTPITVDEWIERSPFSLPREPSGDWRLLLRLFNPNDIVWIGDLIDSGHPVDRIHFKKAETWIQFRNCPGPFICPATFPEGVFHRSACNVIARPFLIVESDILTKPEMGSVFLWLKRELPLRAIVDTGGKSLHGWFEHPKTIEQTEELRSILNGFGCDLTMFRLNQLCRLPGQIREGTNRWQKLLYLDLEKSPFKLHTNPTI